MTSPSLAIGSGNCSYRGGLPRVCKTAASIVAPLRPNLVPSILRLVYSADCFSHVVNTYAIVQSLHCCYAGMLEESARQCDTALTLAPGNYQFRSCAWSFMELGRFDRARDFLQVDAGSEWVKDAIPFTVA